MRKSRGKKLELQAQSEDLACEDKAPKQKAATQQIQKLKVTNLLPGVTKQKLHCVFGKLESVTSIQLNQTHYALIEYSSPSAYHKALEASSAKGVNLLKHRLSIEPVYST